MTQPIKDAVERVYQKLNGWQGSGGFAQLEAAEEAGPPACADGSQRSASREFGLGGSKLTFSGSRRKRLARLRGQLYDVARLSAAQAGKPRGRPVQSQRRPGKVAPPLRAIQATPDPPVAGNHLLIPPERFLRLRASVPLASSRSTYTKP
jgi:hypothetical protein